MSDTEIATQTISGNFDRASQGGLSELVRDIGQRYVDGRRDHAQLIRCQHHHDIIHSTKMREKFCVTGPRKFRPIFQNFFVDRSGANGADLTLLSQRHGGPDHIDDAVSVEKIRLTSLR